MKILFISSNRLDHSTAPGNHALELIRAFRELGHRIQPVARSGEDPELVTCRIFPFPIFGTILTEFSLLLAALRALRAERHDLVYFRIEAQSCFIFLLPMLLPVRFFVEVNGCLEEELRIIGAPSRLRRLARLTERLTYPRADRIIAVTENIRKHLELIHHVPPARVKVVGNGVNGSHFFPRPATKGNFVLGYVGSFAPWQGIDTLLRALSLLGDRGVEVTCVIAGGGHGRAEMERMAERLGLQDRCRFVGHVPYEKLPEVMSGFSVGVIPKRALASGLMPMKFFQFLAMGLPVIVSDVPDMNALIKDSGAGIVFPPDDAECLADAIARLAGDRDLREQCARSAVAIAGKHSWLSQGARILEDLPATALSRARQVGKMPIE